MLTNTPKSIEKFEIQTYEQHHSFRELQKTHVPFSGTPFKHPLDPQKLILVMDPYNKKSPYYEFIIDDIAYMEQLSNVVNLEGEVVTIIRIWVKKMSLAIQATPFVVAEF